MPAHYATASTASKTPPPPKATVVVVLSGRVEGPVDDGGGGNYVVKCVLEVHAVSSGVRCGHGAATAVEKLSDGEACGVL